MQVLELIKVSTSVYTEKVVKKIAHVIIIKLKVLLLWSETENAILNVL